MAEKPLMEVKELRKYFPVTRGILRKTVDWVKAVDGVSFDIQTGETFSIVGESGCGKTTTAKVLLGLEQPTAGNVMWNGTDVSRLRGTACKDYRTSLQAVFQDPWSSLNPRMRVSDIIAEPLVVNSKLPRNQISREVTRLLSMVHLSPDQGRLYPHEFSGGQRQRICIARALALNPRIIILDEPVSALDVSVQAQMMNLLKDLQNEYRLTYLLIAHDFGTVRYMSNRTAVMYLGQIVELSVTRELFVDPMHPYTKALISAALLGRTTGWQEAVVSGEVPSPINSPSGCRFHTRCSLAQDICSSATPSLYEAKFGHFVACHLN